MNMQTTLDQKYGELTRMLSSYRRVIIALSGGLDSSFLLFAAKSTLGVDNTFAAIGVSDSLARSEYEFAADFARSIGLPESQIMAIETQELQNPEYANNPTNRCFFCKTELFNKLNELAKQVHVGVVCDGSNASDVGDHRPGMIAGKQHQVKSPLLEAGLTKEDIRMLAEKFDLSIWDKPQSACLASRIPYGSPVTAAKLKQIEAAEAYLKSLGFHQLRVRHHDQIARIELPLEDMQLIIGNSIRQKIVERFREIGFLFTTLDIAEFRSGSMNIMLKGEDHV